MRISFTYKIWLVSAICFVTALCGLNVSAEVVGTDALYEGFQDSQAAVKKLDLQPENWNVADGLLTSLNKSDSVIDFRFGKPEWRNYELEFKVRRTAINISDQHFGVRLHCSEKDTAPASFLQFYCRGGSVIFMENVAGKTLRHDAVGDLAIPLEVGANAHWTTFRISVIDDVAKVYINGTLLGTVQDVVPRKGQVEFYTYGVVVQIDDINVTVLSTEDKSVQGLEPSRNILSNSSFEYCTQDDLPDYWGCPHWGIQDQYWALNFERWTKCFKTDTETAFDGGRSMRIYSPSDKSNVGSNGLCLRSTQTGSSANEQYVLSAYMKSLQPGMKVNIGGKEVALTTDWQRYSTGFIQDGLSPYVDMINIYPVDNGTFWIDAVQLEKGTELTAYVPSLRDTVLLAQVKGDKSANHVPICTPNKTGSDLKLDGLLDDECWQNAKQLDFGLLNGGTPVESSYAKLTYTAKGIYVGVHCTDASAKEVKCQNTQHDSNVWTDPSIEIFVDPRLSKTDYFHFAFNKDGVMCDAKGTDTTWNCSWKVATHIGDGFWSAEAFLPFNELGIDNMVGERWGINVCRSNQQANEYTCWSPTFAGFHTPDRFGEVVLDSRVLNDYRVFAKDPNLSLLSKDIGTLSINIGNATSKDLDLLVKVSADDGIKPPGELKSHIAKASSEILLFGKFKLKDATAKPWRVSIFTADGKQMLYSSQLALSCPAAIEMTPQFILYTSEKEMRIRLRLGFAGQLINKSTAVISISRDGKDVFKRKLDRLTPENYITVPVAKLPSGKYSLSAKLINKAGGVIAAVNQDFEKMTPQKSEVKIDRFSRSVIVHGKPFLPIGCAWEGDLPIELLKYLAASGSNTVTVFYGMDKIGKLLDDAQKCGLMIKLGISARELDKAVELVNAFKHHPAVLAWDIFDEVFTVEWGKNNYKLVSEACTKLKAVDPYHPVYINENEYGLGYLRSNGLEFPGEIISVDYYAYPPSGNVQAIGDYVRQMYEVGKSGYKPAWIYSFASGYAFWASRDLSASEQVCSTYTSFINGASGLFYWASHPKSKSQWAAIKGLMSEIRQLTPAITSPLAVNQVRSSAPTVEVLTKKYNGALYLITLNTSREPVSAKLDLSSSLPAGHAPKATVMFEKRSVAVKSGVIDDKYAGFERHVYLIK